MLDCVNRDDDTDGEWEPAMISKLQLDLPLFQCVFSRSYCANIHVML